MAGILFRNARGKRVWLPGGAMRDLQSEVISTCMVPTDVHGGMCGAKFVKGQERLVEKHAIACTNRHAGAIREVYARANPAIMLPWDPEMAAWMRQNADAIMSGRMRV